MKKRYQNDDDLERAIFALPLEEPPAGLRESILAATIYRPTATFRTWEVWALGGSVGLLAWLLAWIARDGDAARTFGAIGSALLSVFGNPQTLLWIALGSALAVWYSQLNLTPAGVSRRADRR